MYFKVARIVNVVVVVLMSLEILGASIAALPLTSCYGFTIVPEESSSSILDSILFEKAEEENDKTEEEGVRMSRAVLIDFSRIVLSLSAHHSPHMHQSTNTFRYDVRPPVHQLNCVFLL